MTTTFYGLKTCDTCRKARKALDAAGVDYAYVDVRADGVSSADLKRWASAAGWEKLVNKNSTTWRGLDDGAKADLDEARALALLAAHPTLIKRPVIEVAGAGGSAVYVGWTPETRGALGIA
ncbi:MAG: Spx/MgsR family RNA polymerase-binding regulatory protein [Pseudomonadota bacterium]